MSDTLPGQPAPLTPSAAAAPEGATPIGGFRRGGQLLLAADGSELGGHAARVAAAVAQRTGSALRAIHAVDTRGAPLPPPLDVAIGLADELVGPGVHAEQESEVRGALAAAVGGPVHWPVRVAIGTPAGVIVREAQRSGADLVVLGLRAHGAAGRAFQDETALLVMRRAACPVLAVGHTLDGLPRCVVVGVDFSRTSREAARLALDLLAPGGRLVLAYVSARPPVAPDDGEGYVHALGVAAAFAALVAELAPAAGVRVEDEVLEGRPRQMPAQRLLELAGRAGADLVALGSRRYGRLERWLLGSVTTDLARDGRVSLLVVPPAEPSAAQADNSPPA